EVITRARGLTLRIRGLLRPGSANLNDVERRGLLGLQKRVECLVAPLNFLLTRSSRLDSCVQQVALNTQELLFDVCNFVDQYAPETLSPGGSGGSGSSGHAQACNGASNGIDSDLLEHYLRELEFACASVNMAISILQATGSMVVAPLARAAPGRSQGNILAAGSGCGHSLAALLRASQRIQELCGRTGDLCASPGQLLCQVGEGEWTPIHSNARLKVLADERLGFRRYGLTVDDRSVSRPS
ncbi:unnamed protein product, partial [Polarella glacialis]